MDSMLCDELLQEIFRKLPPSSSNSNSSVSLVSKRWLHVYRNSTTSLSLTLTPQSQTSILSPSSSSSSSLSSLLSHYPFLSSLSLVSSSSEPTATAAKSITTRAPPAYFDNLLFVISTSCSNLKRLRFLPGPVSSPSLVSLSKTSTGLVSLTVSLSRPLFFNWVTSFPCLKELSVYLSGGGDSIGDGNFYFESEVGFSFNQKFDTELGLETLSLSGIQSDDMGIGWLWRSCKNLKKLQLKNCSGIGDGGSFPICLQNLEEIELKTSRSITGIVLLKLAENCDSLNSLLIYDGCSNEGLLQFINNCHCNLRKLDFRLPLDLNNDHLIAIGSNFRDLSSFRLQSSCLVTGDGLKSIGVAMRSKLQELALINCDVVEREPGLLATLGQNLENLRKLDLSYNEMLLDKEFVAMLGSCGGLVELKLRGCKGLTSTAMVSVSRSCKKLESVDIMQCGGIESRGVESFVLNSRKLRRVEVEENKVLDVTKMWTSSKFIEVVV